MNYSRFNQLTFKWRHCLSGRVKQFGYTMSTTQMEGCIVMLVGSGNDYMTTMYLLKTKTIFPYIFRVEATTLSKLSLLIWTRNEGCLQRIV